MDFTHMTERFAGMAEGFHPRTTDGSMTLVGDLRGVVLNHRLKWDSDFAGLMDLTEMFNTCEAGLPFSVEILPPNRGLGLSNIHEFFRGLDGWKPAFVSVTYHRAHRVEVQGENGPEWVWNRKNPGALGVCAMLKFQYGLNVMPHVICGGFSKFDSEDYLVELDYLGLKHVLALRGDADKNDPHFVPHPQGYAHANQLVEHIVRLNHGDYLEGVNDARPTDFSIGVAGYPEVHAEASDLASDVANLKRKVDAGASFIITQMFFDNAAFFRFVDACREAGIDVPIVPGIKVLTSKRQLEVLPAIFHTVIPPSLVEAVKACSSDEEVVEVGLNHAEAQTRELLASGVPGIHFFTMNNSRVFNQLIHRMRG
jgi:methylenetetrahydrofolate reductase (NADPH)